MRTTMCETNKYQSVDKTFTAQSSKSILTLKINKAKPYYVNLICYTNDIVSELNITLQRLTRLSN